MGIDGIDGIVASLGLMFVSVTAWSVTVIGEAFGKNAAALVFKDVSSPVTVTVQRGGRAGCRKPTWEFDRILTVTKENSSVHLQPLATFTHYRLMDGNSEKLRGQTLPS